MAKGRPVRRTWASRRSACVGVRRLAVGVAWAFAAVIVVLLAMAFAAALVVAAVVASFAFLAVALVARVRRLRPVARPEVIEAHHVGGHSWVAYGWDP